MFRLKEAQQDLGVLIADAFSLLRQTWAPNLLLVMIGLLVVAAMIAGLNYGILHGLAQPHTATTVQLKMTQVNMTQVSQWPQLFKWLGLIAVISAWVVAIFHAILVRACWNSASTGKIRAGNAIGVAFRYCLVFLAQAILLGALMLLERVIGFYLSHAHLFWLDLGYGLIGQLFIYYVLVRLLLVNSAAVIDECGFKAFVRSWQYTRGYWWRTLLVCVLPVFFYSVFILVLIYGVVSALGAPIFNALWMYHPDVWVKSILAGTWISNAHMGLLSLSALILVLTLPSLLACSRVVLYYDLKHRHRREQL
jgi:hypothetical protein